MKTNKFPRSLRKNPVASQSGFSIVLLVMATSIFSLAVISSVLAQSNASLDRLKMPRIRGTDLMNLKTEINFILTSNDGCRSNFAKGGYSLPSASSVLKISTIEYNTLGGAATSALIDLSTSNGRFGKVQVTGMQIKGDPVHFGAPGAGSHLAILEILISDQGQLARRQKPLQIPIFVTTDDSGRILDCRATQYFPDTSPGALPNAKITLEEKLCKDPGTVAQTANWPADCMTCASGSDPYYFCMYCKTKGKRYDRFTNGCI